MPAGGSTAHDPALFLQDGKQWRWRCELNNFARRNIRRTKKEQEGNLGQKGDPSRKAKEIRAIEYGRGVARVRLVNVVGLVHGGGEDRGLNPRPIF
jgi:hypothetical protein